MDEHDPAEARARLARLIWPARLPRPAQRRLWSRATVRELGYGWERGRVLIPIGSAHHELRGVLRYAPPTIARPRCWPCPAPSSG